MEGIVDRIENDIAIILFGDKEIKVDIPLEILPKGIREGNVINAKFEIDEDKEEKQVKKMESLLEKIKNK